MYASTNVSSEKIKKKEDHEKFITTEMITNQNNNKKIVKEPKSKINMVD